MSVRTWRLIPFQTASAAENMAIDEALFLENQHCPGAPTLRFYNWARPTVSLGMFQDIATEICLDACRACGVDVVRRITGGKAVLHDAELTYSVIGQEDEPGFPAGILGRYRAISEAISEALSHVGIETEMKKDKREDAASDDLNGFCFSVPSQYELLVGKRKVCGSAQARSKGAFLQHGSLLIDFDPARVHELMTGQQGVSEKALAPLRRSVTCLSSETTCNITIDNLCEILSTAFEDRFNIRLIADALTPREQATKLRLMDEKYLTDRWNHFGKIID